MEFEKAITANGGADPLAKWKEYIAWAELHATAGDATIDRTKLLERCVMQFRQYDQYKNDERYLRICLKYVCGVGEKKRTRRKKKKKRKRRRRRSRRKRRKEEKEEEESVRMS